MDTALFSLYAIYYTFSIAYPQEHKDIFLYIDSVLVGMQTATNRISLQRFVKTVKSLI
jgi:hypothetical protein